MQRVLCGEFALRRTTAILAAAVVLLAGLLSSSASAVPPADETCLSFVTLDTDGEGNGSSRFVQGQVSAVIAFAFVDEDDGCDFLPSLGYLTSDDWGISDLPDGITVDGVDWDSIGVRGVVLIGGGTGEDPESSVWTQDGIKLTTTPIATGDGPLSSGFTVAVSSGFTVDVHPDAPLGDHSGTVKFTRGGTETTMSFSISVVARTGSGSSDPAAVLLCDPAVLAIGTTATCTVTTGAPDFDIQWRASTNPVFASGVVRTDASGVGRFSFVVPSAALGEDVLVEMVDWTSPTSIGVAGGPVPSRVPAGEGSVPFGSAVGVALFAFGSLVVSMFRRPRRSVIG